jgi:hypothetical protein
MGMIGSQVGPGGREGRRCEEGTTPARVVVSGRRFQVLLALK